MGKWSIFRTDVCVLLRVFKFFEWYSLFMQPFDKNMLITIWICAKMGQIIVLVWRATAFKFVICQLHSLLENWIPAADQYWNAVITIVSSPVSINWTNIRLSNHCILNIQRYNLLGFFWFGVLTLRKTAAFNTRSHISDLFCIRNRERGREKMNSFFKSL